MRPLLGSRRGAVVALVAGSILSGLTESAILAALAEAAAALVNGTSHAILGIGPAHLMLSVGALLGATIVLALVRLALQWVVSYFPARIAANLQAELSNEVFTAFTQASWEVQSRDREGHLQELATNQVAQATLGALQAATLVVATLTFAVLVLSALVLNVLAAIVVLITAIALFAVLRPLSSLGSRQGHAVSRASLEYANGVTEAVRLAEETHVFGVASAQNARVAALVDQVRHPYFHTQFLYRFVSGFYQSLVFLLVGAALLALYLTGAGDVAALGAVVLLLVRAGTYGQQAQASYQGLLQTIPYLDRIEDARKRYLTSRHRRGGRALSGLERLTFEDVSFSYEPGRPVLSGITFEVEHGETVGVVGPSGAGKSTLVQLLLGLRSPDSGAYLVNGLPAHQIRTADWHQTIAYLPQEPRLLHASVAANIALFRDVSHTAIERAARLAGIHGEISGWPEGYDTIIGPRADAISGGQQQRVCLARALAAEPDLLVLDEPTSALDSGNERLIQETLDGLMGAVTLIIVAHRVSTLASAQRIIALGGGTIEAFASPEALTIDDGRPAIQRAEQRHC